MTPLNKKLFRDLWHIRGQVIAIALVIAGGVASLVMALGAVYSLEETRSAYYERYRFANVFAHATRAPEWLLGEIAEIPGVMRVQARIQSDIIFDLPGMVEPGRARVQSLEIGAEGRLNDVVIRQGRTLRPNHPDEVLVHEAFAEAQDLVPGDTIFANINQKRRKLTIVGIALSPEYTYAIGPGDIIPDDRHFVVMWMDRKALEAAYDLKGAFNDVALTLSLDASRPAVIRRLDQLLDGYGGVGAYARQDQLSHAFMDSEFQQLRNLASVLPPIFLGVAAFLLNIVIARLVRTEREQIGLLKAFGYRNRDVALHYLKFVGIITSLGVLLGWAGGTWMGQIVTAMYAEYFRFPFLYYMLDPGMYLIAGAVSFAAAALGTATALRRVIRLEPAAAMVPPPPTAYRKKGLEKLTGGLQISQASRMIIRHVLRWPLRSGLTIMGIAFSVGTLVVSLFFIDAINEMMEFHFFETERQDYRLQFVEIRPYSAIDEIARLPAVLTVEGDRAVPVRLRHENFEERIVVRGLEPGAELTRLVDAELRPFTVPSEGIVISEKLAQKLGAALGDTLTLETLDGRRRVVDVPVNLIVKQYIGLSAIMDLDALNRLIGDGPVISGVKVLTDSAADDRFFAELKQVPALAGLGLKARSYELFRKLIEESIYTMLFFYFAFALMISIGVAYNSARISLSERGRELATLRVLGFTRQEVGFILIGELAVLTFFALPIGCVIGYLLAGLFVGMFDTDLYRMPFVVSDRTYGYSVLIVALASIASAWIVVRRIGDLDLIAVLKTRE